MDILPCQKGKKQMTTEFLRLASQNTMTVLHELDLGQHTLFILKDKSIDILDLEGSAPYLADNGVRLDSDETYRLFISLWELFKAERP
jgi:hypothetical protein